MPEVVHALLENADDRKRNAKNLECLANGQIVAAVLFLGELLRYDRALDVSRVVCFIEKPALGDDQVADLLVLRR